MKSAAGHRMSEITLTTILESVTLRCPENGSGVPLIHSENCDSFEGVTNKKSYEVSIGKTENIEYSDLGLKRFHKLVSEDNVKVTVPFNTGCTLEIGSIFGLGSDVSDTVELGVTGVNYFNVALRGLYQGHAVTCLMYKEISDFIYAFSKGRKTIIYSGSGIGSHSEDVQSFVLGSEVNTGARELFEVDGSQLRPDLLLVALELENFDRLATDTVQANGFGMLTRIKICGRYRSGTSEPSY